MSRRLLSYAALLAVAAPGCTPSDTAEPTMTRREHSDRLMTRLAVGEAIDEPNGGNYARAVAIIQATDRPEGVKRFEIGELVVASYAHPGSRKAPISFQQGLAMMEEAAVLDGESRGPAQQRLRIKFERGFGIPPHAIPIDLLVADCWHRLELDQPGDPARCVALRRHRLPQLSVGSAPA